MNEYERIYSISATNLFNMPLRARRDSKYMLRFVANDKNEISS